MAFGIGMKRLILLVFLIGVLLPVYSQNNFKATDPQSVKVDQLSDDQIRKLMDQIEKNNLSEVQAVNLARAKGMTQIQIDQLKSRMEALKSGKSSQKSNVRKDSTSMWQDKHNFNSERVKIDSSKVDNRIFGFQFFNNENLTFEPNLTIPVSSSYVIGSGDEFQVDVWGLSEQSYQLAVDRQGNVVIPQVGVVSVGNLTLEEAQRRLIFNFSKIYSDLSSPSPSTFVNISLSQLKAIKVHVIGEVFVPGSYTLPGTASAFNALYLCGGPNKNGSFRDIQILRDGKKIASLDVYDFLINGNSSVNVALRDNDVILVPPYLKRVKAGGEFKRPGLFESKEGETVKDVLNYTGGFTENAYTSRIELYRNTSVKKEFKNVFEADFNHMFLVNGDSLFAGKISDRIDNMVSIDGAVFRPGAYEYEEGMSLKSLIDMADGVTENAFMNRGFVTRLKPDYTPYNFSFDVKRVLTGDETILLKGNDKIFIAFIDSIRETQTVFIGGEVLDAGHYRYSEGMTLGDLVIMSGGLKESASESSIEVMRRLPYHEADKSTTATAQLFQFAISRDLKMDNQGASFVLGVFDEVFVRSMPGFKGSSSAAIYGHVMYGGDYGLSSWNERISDLVKRAGGLTSNSYPEGARLIRKQVMNKEDLARREDLMLKDSTIRFSSYDFDVISIDLPKILANPGCKEDIYLKDKDLLRIPSIMQTVKISGEVLNPSATVYTKGWTTKKYVNRSGGFAVNAKQGKTYVLYPNGSSSATKGYLFFKKYPKITPGAEIVVPKKPERERIGPQGWVGIGSSLASIALVIATIW
ncbi:protein involved in polysaccharide export with SLBB domain [Breznakibacter xylanolyticus]|uniref:Protein involved in polysaccharide export with SLBB domain n=1 Tax=Breznakibacter xylanolyticus TaxID=990 RepID=A0A2W7NFM4_9BACT|nr:SLBB domain-containing protein [Breznakibacter xylanolyticus]PZX19175.1 protein involved in polysaccharide export with SLBB domain [Breznakibacter xylanolyticus]